MDLSNKALAVLLLIAIAASIGGTLISLSHLDGITGHATDTSTGEINFTINNQFSIRFVNNAVMFGTGYVNSTDCTMGTNATPPSFDADGCSGFNETVNATNLTIENDGNIRANVSLNFSSNATGFIGGTNPSFQYRVYNHESGSCVTVGNGTSFQEVGVGIGSTASNDTNLTGSRICTNLNFTDASDLLGIAVWIRIPQTASSGSHRVTITAIGCDDTSC